MGRQFHPPPKKAQGEIMRQGCAFSNTHSFRAFGVAQGDNGHPALYGKGDMVFFDCQ